MTEYKSAKPSQFYIHIQERISPQISNWFEEAEIVNTDQGGSIIKFNVIDQAALHGLLTKIRDLNLTLISVSKIVLPNEAGQGDQDTAPVK